MMKPVYLSASALLTAGLLLGTNTMVLAQSTATTQATAPQPGEQPGEQNDDTANQAQEVHAPVLHVTSVEIIRSTHEPVLDIIRVRGLVSTQGWEQAELVPLTRGTPSDGVLDLAFIAKAPSDSMEATGFEEIEAIFPLEPKHPYKGVRVHSGSGSVTVKDFPGYAEGEKPTDDCSKCVGKYFIAKGAPMPSGAGEDQVVHQEKMPAKLRIIQASGGLDKIDSDPNRLTIVVGEDGKIITAFWD